MSEEVAKPVEAEDKPKKLMQITDGDIKQFAAAALQGIAANPQYCTPQMKMWMNQHNTSWTKIAVGEALKMTMLLGSLDMNKLGGVEQSNEEGESA